MKKRSPFDVIHSRHVTEKSQVLSQLKDSNRNRSSKLCKTPKAVFIVDPRANKQEIAEAITEIYQDRKVTVKKVNVLNVKPRPRRMRGRAGFKPAFKKAIVSFQEGDQIDNL